MLQFSPSVIIQQKPIICGNNMKVFYQLSINAKIVQDVLLNENFNEISSFIIQHKALREDLKPLSLRTLVVYQ